MLARYREGYDVVYAQRTRRHGETIFKRATAAIFYWLMRKFVHRELPMNSGDFRLMSREAVVAVRHLREGQRFMRGMITWVGFSQTPVFFERSARVAGETKYPLRKMLALAWDATLSFSYIPLRAASWFGFVVFVLGTIYGIRVFVDALTSRRDLEPGWASIIVLECLVGGAILFCLGMIGEYVGRIYEESKQRPLYIVRRTRNVEARQEPPRAVAPSGEARFTTEYTE
jgi:dolichol-phosphate mannosyltransferase